MPVTFFMPRLSKQAFVGGCISLTGTMLLGPEPNLIHRTDIGRQLPQDLPDLGAGVAQWVQRPTGEPGENNTDADWSPRGG